MSWNHRVIASRDAKTKEFYFQIHEVYYDDDGKPKAHTAEPVSVGGNTLQDIRWTLNRMQEATKKPFLIYEDDKYIEWVM